ncbi:MAG: hypothetical protein Fur0032_22430 [Terrimicrobiaceae bacterium]
MKRPILKRGSRGLTVVELLVVTAITIILMALGLPTIGHVFVRGKTADTLQRLRNLQLANQSYTAEHNGRFMPLYAGPGVFEFGWKWNGEFLSYLGLSEADIGSRQWEKVMRSPFWNESSAPHAEIAYHSDSEGYHSARLTNPAMLVAFIDANDWWVNKYAFADWPGPDADGKLSAPTPAYRHAGRKAAAVTYAGNVLMLTQEDLDWTDSRGAKHWVPTAQ